MAQLFKACLKCTNWHMVREIEEPVNYGEYALSVKKNKRISKCVDNVAIYEYVKSAIGEQKTI